jgi:para-nitrobenzyl esterase
MMRPMTALAHTSLGSLQGAPEGAAAAFRGVPYAAPPIGDRRFAPPAAPPPWAGTLDATKDGPIAPQAPSRLRDAMGDFARPQDEDCLTLTIWTPAADAGSRPVLVWLHGGAWSSGSGSLAWYDGGRLAREQDIVVVGVNYRLGALGYLHVPGISPGNLGTMDQVAALRWVRDHIAAFGGDPARVTVGGQSAGAASIGRMIADPAARPLFRAAILQSGGFGRPPLSRDEAAEIGREYVGLLGAEDIRTAPVAKLIEAQGTLARSRARFAETTPPFMPLVETPMTEAELLGTVADAAGGLDVLIGTTREEVHAFYAANPAMTDPPENAALARFAALAGSADAIEAYRRRRPGGSLMDLLADLGTDHTFGWPSLRLADAIAARGGRVHAYRFDWAPPRGKFKACHCIELPFTFGTFDAWPDAVMLAGADFSQMAALSATIRAHWGRFVHTGAPGPSWPHYDEHGRLTMLFDDICAVAGDPSGLGWRA